MSPLTMWQTTVFPWAFIFTTPTATASRRTTNCPGVSGTERKSYSCTPIGRTATSPGRGTSTWPQRALLPDSQDPRVEGRGRVKLRPLRRRSRGERAPVKLGVGRKRKWPPETLCPRSGREQHPWWHGCSAIFSMEGHNMAQPVMHAQMGGEIAGAEELIQAGAV